MRKNITGTKTKDQGPKKKKIYCRYEIKKQLKGLKWKSGYILGTKTYLSRYNLKRIKHHSSHHKRAETFKHPNKVTIEEKTGKHVYLGLSKSQSLYFWEVFRRTAFNHIRCQRERSPDKTKDCSFIIHLQSILHLYNQLGNNKKQGKNLKWKFGVN